MGRPRACPSVDATFAALALDRGTPRTGRCAGRRDPADHQRRDPQRRGHPRGDRHVRRRRRFARHRLSVVAGGNRGADRRRLRAGDLAARRLAPAPDADPAGDRSGRHLPVGARDRRMRRRSRSAPACSSCCRSRCWRCWRARRPIVGMVALMLGLAALRVAINGHPASGPALYWLYTFTTVGFGLMLGGYRTDFAVATYRMRMRLHRQASTDELTGLLNRAGWNRDATAAYAAAVVRGRPLSVAFFDIDRFKVVNDTYGHAAGDQILQSLGQILKERHGLHSHCARLGGEEFVVLFVDETPEAVEGFVQRVRRSFAAIAHRPRGHGQRRRRPSPALGNHGPATAACRPGRLRSQGRRPRPHGGRAHLTRACAGRGRVTPAAAPAPSTRGRAAVGCTPATGCRLSAWKALRSRAIGSSRNGSSAVSKRLRQLAEAALEVPRVGARRGSAACACRPAAPWRRRRARRRSCARGWRASAQRQAAQAVVGAQRDHHHRGPVRASSRDDARGAAGAGFAADAGVDHAPAGLGAGEALRRSAPPSPARRPGRSAADSESPITSTVRRARGRLRRGGRRCASAAREQQRQRQQPAPADGH